MKKRQTGRVGAVEAEFFNGLLVLSKTERTPDRVDELVGHWDTFGKVQNVTDD
ncbi:hypothetical protein N5O88_17030 [Pseudomonas sp. GD03721]|nr:MULTISPECIES: hypothetical protein [Pseudomonas]MDV5862569.1 hypothetical protein [Pseudomonas mendocina]WGG00774.1 hypothetical protein N5O88_17030 [Pseudomonas sp. GD03721]WGG04942.1 hypothetical protein N5O87_17060 [Pseudomonas sp. GD03919]